MSDSNLHDHGHPPPPRNPNILPTEEEREAEERGKREAADKETDNSYKERQSKAAEAANNLARTNRNLTVMVIILTAVTACASWFQGCMNHRSWKAAQDTLDQMKRDSHTSGEQFQAQLRHYDEGLGRTGLLAVHAGEQVTQTATIAKNSAVQASATRKSAEAADSAAETAKETLHISERAYVVVGAPVLHASGKSVNVPILNDGRVPSGRIFLTIHEATINVPPAMKVSYKYQPIEIHWKRSVLESAVPNVTGLGINVPLPSADIEKIKSGTQQVFVVGNLAYNDGFPRDADVIWPFCYGTVFSEETKELNWSPCDSSMYLSQMIEIDKYPANEYH